MKIGKLSFWGLNNDDLSNLKGKVIGDDQGLHTG